jgi:hypothetical protein
LNEFLETAMHYREQQQEFDSIYQFIIAYEADIIKSGDFDLHDKQVILTTTSITRYALYFAKKHRRRPRDRDWDISWGNIVGGTEGSSENTAKAIIMSTVIGLITNK